MLSLLGAADAALTTARPGFQVPPTNELFDLPCIVNLHLGSLNLCINKTVNVRHNKAPTPPLRRRRLSLFLAGSGKIAFSSTTRTDSNGNSLVMLRVGS